MRHVIGKEVDTINAQMPKLDCPKTDVKSDDWVLDLENTV
jgi:hypothetical protein